jgi:hypothetical protein
VRQRLEIFRRHLLAWSIPLGLLALNVAWLSAFGSGARLRAADLEGRLERARDEHARETSLLAEREKLWIAANENRERTRALYDERFSTESARLTAAMREVKDLASRAGLEPRSISYPEERLEEYGLLRRSFVFSVEGTYTELRTFLHLLELSSSFVAVDSIQVGERSPGALGVALRLSTLFATEAEPAAAAPEARP